MFWIIVVVVSAVPHLFLLYALPQFNEQRKQELAKARKRKPKKTDAGDPIPAAYEEGDPVDENAKPVYIDIGEESERAFELRSQGREVNHPMAWAILFLTITFIGHAGGWFVHYIGTNFLNLNPEFSYLTGIWLGLQMFGSLVPEFFVRTDQLLKYVATSPYTGLLRDRRRPESLVFPQGTLSIAYPFLQRSTVGNVTTETMEQPIELLIPGKNEILIFKGTVQFQTRRDQSPGFIGLSEEVVANGLLPVIQSQIAVKTSNKTIDQAKSGLQKINDEIQAIIMGADTRDKASDFEHKYSIVVTNIVISHVTTSEAMQDSMDSVGQSRKTFEAVAAMYSISMAQLEKKLKDGTMSHQAFREAVQLVLAKNGQAEVSMTTHTVGHHTDNLAAAMARMLPAKNKGDS